jgi:hypothetical protein
MTFFEKLMKTLGEFMNSKRKRERKRHLFQKTGGDFELKKA